MQKQKMILAGIGLALAAALVLMVMVGRLSGEVETQREQIKKLKGDAAEAVLAAEAMRGVETRLQTSAHDLRQLQRQVARLESAAKAPTSAPPSAVAGEGGGQHNPLRAPEHGSDVAEAGQPKAPEPAVIPQPMGVLPSGDEGTPVHPDAAPVTQGEVKGLVQEAQQQERKQRREQREQRRAERLAQDVKVYAETLNLSQLQSDELHRIFSESQSLSRSIREQARNGEIDWDEAQEMMKSQKSGTAEQVTTLLGPERTEELKHMREKEQSERDQRRGGGGVWP